MYCKYFHLANVFAELYIMYLLFSLQIQWDYCVSIEDMCSYKQRYLRAILYGAGKVI